MMNIDLYDEEKDMIKMREKEFELGKHICIFSERKNGNFRHKLTCHHSAVEVNGINLNVSLQVN